MTYAMSSAGLDGCGTYLTQSWGNLCSAVDYIKVKKSIALRQVRDSPYILPSSERIILRLPHGGQMANASWKLCSMSGLQTPSASAADKSYGRAFIIKHIIVMVCCLDYDSICISTRQQQFTTYNSDSDKLQIA